MSVGMGIEGLTAADKTVSPCRTYRGYSSADKTASPCRTYRGYSFGRQNSLPGLTSSRFSSECGMYRSQRAIQELTFGRALFSQIQLNTADLMKGAEGFVRYALHKLSAFHKLGERLI